jgi:succinate dehydrogenase / fumarate reductase, flavoprotein subunit
MARHIGIFRERNDLEEGLRQLLLVRERINNTHVEGSVMFNPGWHLARDLENLFVCAEATCRAALLRRESRGAHSRTDYPKEDPELGKVNMCVRKSADGMSVSPTTCPQMPDELRKLFES